jgi:hypothetical protein
MIETGLSLIAIGLMLSLMSLCFLAGFVCGAAGERLKVSIKDGQ